MLKCVLSVRIKIYIYKIGYYVYADDTQLYISFKCKQPLEAISNSCLSDIRRWMITNKFRKHNLSFLDLHN